MEDATEPLPLPEEIERDGAGEFEGDQSKLRAINASSRGREERGNSRSSKPQREHKGVKGGHGGEQSPSQEPSEKADRTLALRDLGKYEESKLRETGPGPDKTNQGRDDRAERGREGRTRDKERGREIEEKHAGTERGRINRDRKEREKHEREPTRGRNWHERGVGGRGRENERERGRDRDRETLRERDKDREKIIRRDWGRGDDRDRRDRNRVSETDLGKRSRGNDKASYRKLDKESLKGFRARRERDRTESPPLRKDDDNKRNKRGRAEQVEGSRQNREKDDLQADKVESTISEPDNQTAKTSSQVSIPTMDSIQVVDSERENDNGIPNETSNGSLLPEKHSGGSMEGGEPHTSTLSGKTEEVLAGKEQQEGDDVPESCSLQEAKGDDKLVNEKLDASKEGDGSSSKRAKSEKHRRDRRDEERDSRVKKGDRKVNSSRDERRTKEESSGRSSQRSHLSREDSSRRSDRRSPTLKQPQSRSRSPRRALLADVDSRYRKFGGGRSGLGGYSPRRRRASPDPQSRSPSRKSKSKSPEKKKVRTWDQVPAGMSPSVAAAMQQYVVAQQAVSQATAAQQAAAKAQQAFAVGQNPFGLAALGLSAGATSSSSLSSTLPSMSVPNSLPVSLPSALSGTLHGVSETMPATLQGLSAALVTPVPGSTSSASNSSIASVLLGNTVNSSLTSVASNVPSLAAPLSSTAFSSISALSAFNPPAGTNSNAGTVPASIPGLTSALVSGLPSISPMLASLLPQMAAATAASTPVLSQATRPARRLYVGNMPATVSDGELMEFINAALISVNANHLPGTKPCINCSVNIEKGYAFAEFITPEDAVAALALDGISLHGTTLKIRRPKDYAFPSAGQTVTSTTTTPTSEVVPVVDLVSSTVVDSPYKVFIGGISPSLPLEKVKEIITAFGQLRAFRLETDTSVRPARAYAFAEYTELAVTGAACAGLSGLQLGPTRLTVCRATPGAPLQAKADAPPFYGIPEEAKPLLEPPTKIVELCHMFTEEELRGISDDDFQEVEEDIRIECAKLGNVKSLHIVRPEESPQDEENRESTLEASGLASSGETVISSTSVEGTGTQVTDDTVAAIKADAQECEDVVKTDEIKTMNVEANQGEETTGTTTMEPVVAQPAESCSTGATDGKVQASETETSLDTKHEENVDKIGVKKSGDLIEGGGKARSSSGVQEEKRNDAEVEPWRVGRVYVEYSREDSACKAAHALHGRLFNGRKITCTYLPLRLYQRKFKKGLQPRTVEEKQALALAVQSHLTSHL